MRSKLLLCASKIIIDRNDNKISIIDLIENFAAVKFPVIFHQLYFLWTLEREKDDASDHVGKICIRLNGEIIGQFDVKIDFQNSRNTRALLITNNIVVPKAGTLIVTAEIPGVPIKSNEPYSIEAETLIPNTSPQATKH